MDGKLRRRDFLRTAPAGGLLALAAEGATEAADASKAKPKASEVTISAVKYTPVPDYPIQPKRYSDVKINDAFWKPKITTNAEVTIPFEVQKLTGSGSRRGFGGGVLEAAILSLKTHPDANLQTQVDTAIQAIKNGKGSGNRWFEIAAAYYNVTGDRELIDKSIKSADALYEDFKVNNPPFSGGERDAINCVQLYRVTHDKKHLDLAKHYLDIRGLPNSVNRSRHNQSYKPVLEQTEAVGHAVNCVSLMVSLCDVGVLTGIREYLETSQRMWQDTVARKMYITGGVGSTGNEGFGAPYSLPNISAYSETCAVLMYITLNHRLFMATGDSKYIDVMERGMYNNAIDGVSASGDHFFYVNRLASAGDGRDDRWQRASLECCPPNLVRFLASMPGFIYAQDKQETIYINLYVSSETVFKVATKDLSISVESDMPWAGKSRISLSAKENVKAIVKLRVPGWARNQPAPGGLYSYLDRTEKQRRLSINGKSVAASVDKLGYISLDRNWSGEAVVEIEFPLEVRKVTADPRVVEDRGRMAIERGPLVYCTEWRDTADGRVLDLLFDPKAELKSSFSRELYGGVTLVSAAARKITNPSSAPQSVTLIPYHLWANRGAGEMSVWLSRAEYSIGDTGPAGGLIFYENPNYLTDGWRYLEAAPYDQSAGAKWGCFRKLIAGARGTTVGTGKQNTLDMLSACPGTGTAAALTADLTVSGIQGWFLPSTDELDLIYRNLKVKGLGNFPDAAALDNVAYWTSSQQTADMAAHIDFADLGRHHGDDKDFARRVRAIRAF
jgi:DUF1680 family protein